MSKAGRTFGFGSLTGWLLLIVPNRLGYSLREVGSQDDENSILCGTFSAS